MTLNIKNDETERLARALAGATGESITRAVTEAVRERLARVQGSHRSAVTERTARLQAIARDAAGRWTEPLRSADHGELLYDERGLPR